MAGTVGRPIWFMPLEPYVVIAGAGSGKTSVMAARAVYLALVAIGRVHATGPGVLPGNVLCLTFTNKATEHLTLRVRTALGAIELEEGEEPTVLNYHAFAAQILERHGLLVGIEPGQRILTAAQRAELCARVLDEMAFHKVSAEWQPTLIGKILIPEMVANVTFGGAKLNRLFICGTTSLYSIYLTTNGSKLG